MLSEIAPNPIPTTFRTAPCRVRILSQFNSRSRRSDRLWQKVKTVFGVAPAVVVAAAMVPALLALWVVVVADHRPEPPAIVWMAFLLGAFALFAIRLVSLWLASSFSVPHNPWLDIDEHALFVVSIPEESIKILVVAIIALRPRIFEEPMDGVVYGAAVGLGFAAHENIRYLVASPEWETLAVVRGVLTVPFHAALGIIAGS